MDQATRSLKTCSAAWIGMKLGRKLNWDAKLEAFVNDDKANAMRSRKARSAEYAVHEIMKKAGIRTRFISWFKNPRVVPLLPGCRHDLW